MHECEQACTHLCGNAHTDQHEHKRAHARARVHMHMHTRKCTRTRTHAHTQTESNPSCTMLPDIRPQAHLRGETGGNALVSIDRPSGPSSCCVPIMAWQASLTPEGLSPGLPLGPAPPCKCSKKKTGVGSSAALRVETKSAAYVQAETYACLNKPYCWSRNRIYLGSAYKGGGVCHGAHAKAVGINTAVKQLRARRQRGARNQQRIRD